MCKMIDTNGMNIDDIEDILIKEKRVASLKDYQIMQNAFKDISTLCMLAVGGNVQAINYLENEIENIFNDFIAPNDRELVINESKEELNRYWQEENNKNLEKDYESLLLGYAEYVALNALAQEGDELSNRYIKEKAVEDFNGFIPDENKGMILERVKNSLDHIYEVNKENELQGC